jgi:predicted dehydrogenase
MGAPKKKLKVGIVGCGVVATAYYMPYMLRHKDDYEMVAVCDINRRRTELCARLFGVPEVYTDYYDMIKKADIEAVFILTGPGTHAVFAIAAAEAGKHFVLQKPMALNMADANRITNAVNKHNVVALIEPSDHSPLDPRYTAMRELVAKGVLGNPYWFEYNMLGPDHYHVSLGGNPYGIGAFYAKDSGGFLFDFPYAPCAIVNILGSCKSVQGLASIALPDRTVVPDSEYDTYLERCTDPFGANYWEEVVTAPRTQAVKMEAPDNVFSMYEMDSGWIGEFHAGRMFHPIPKGLTGGGLHIWGTEGNLVFGHRHFASLLSTKKDLLPATDSDGWCHFEQPGDFSKSKWPIPAPGAFNYYEASTAHLLECVRENKQPVIDANFGRHITEMMCGAIISAETGRRYEMTTTTAGLRKAG